MPPVIKNNWKDATVLIAVLGAVVTVVFYLAPLKTIPQDVKDTRSDVIKLRNTQTAQTEVLKQLARTAEDTKQIRRDVDRNTTDLENLEKRVDRYHP